MSKTHWIEDLAKLLHEKPQVAIQELSGISRSSNFDVSSLYPDDPGKVFRLRSTATGTPPKALPEPVGQETRRHDVTHNSSKGKSSGTSPIRLKQEAQFAEKVECASISESVQFVDITDSNAIKSSNPPGHSPDIQSKLKQRKEPQSHQAESGGCVRTSQAQVGVHNPRNIGCNAIDEDEMGSAPNTQHETTLAKEPVVSNPETETKAAIRRSESMEIANDDQERQFVTKIVYLVLVLIIGITGALFNGILGIFWFMVLVLVLLIVCFMLIALPHVYRQLLVVWATSITAVYQAFRLEQVSEFRKLFAARLRVGWVGLYNMCRSEVPYKSLPLPRYGFTLFFVIVRIIFVHLFKHGSILLKKTAGFIYKHMFFFIRAGKQSYFSMEVIPDLCGLYTHHKMKVAHPTPEMLTAKDNYPMWSLCKGKAFILNNAEFEGNDRKGSEIDLQNIKHLFTELGYETVVHENLTGEEIMTGIRDFSATFNGVRAVYDSAVVVLMSHGDTGVILGTDRAKVYLCDIEQVLTSNTYPQLKNKPKMIFVQACRGTMAVPVAADVIKSGKPSPADNVRTDLVDVFYAFSTTDGHQSLRSETSGSFFVQALCEVFFAKAHIKNISGLMDDVTDCINHMNGSLYDSALKKHVKVRQIPERTSRLRKALFFQPNYPQASS